MGKEKYWREFRTKSWQIINSFEAFPVSAVCYWDWDCHWELFWENLGIFELFLEGIDWPLFPPNPTRGQVSNCNFLFARSLTSASIWKKTIAIDTKTKTKKRGSLWHRGVFPGIQFWKRQLRQLIYTSDIYILQTFWATSTSNLPFWTHQKVDPRFIQ